MDIQILNIEYRLMETERYETCAKGFKIKDYLVTYYLDGIKDTIEIPTNRELTIEEIKTKIKREPLATIKVELNKYDSKLLTQICEGLLLEDKETKVEPIYDATNGKLTGRIFKVYEK